jgi:hypothetical protein
MTLQIQQQCGLRKLLEEFTITQKGEVHQPILS